MFSIIKLMNKKKLLVEKDIDCSRMSEKFNKDRDELTNELLKIKQQNFEFGLKNQNLEKITDEMKTKN